jgi:mannitol 2-dehydrogenase
MSCDNLQNNGDLTRRMLTAFLELRDPALAGWVARGGAFPNSMVDRITPATTDEHRALVRERFGIEDAWPVTTEPFTQWVVEDHFVEGRPAWERVGAQMIQDVEHYEKMKIRLLNGSHQVMCYVGMLLGYRYAPEAMADPQIERLLQKYMDDEVTPLLAPVPGIDLEDYKRTLRERFANPAIKDQLARIGTDGSSRIPEFVLPTLLEQLLQGRAHQDRLFHRGGLVPLPDRGRRPRRGDADPRRHGRPPARARPPRRGRPARAAVAERAVR